MKLNLTKNNFSSLISFHKIHTIKNFLTTLAGGMVLANCGEMPVHIKSSDKTAQEINKKNQAEEIREPPSPELLKTWPDGEISIGIFRAGIALNGIRKKIQQLELKRNEIGLDQDEAEWLIEMKKSLIYYKKFYERLKTEYKRRIIGLIDA